MSLAPGDPRGEPPTLPLAPRAMWRAAAACSAALVLAAVAGAATSMPARSDASSPALIGVVGLVSVGFLPVGLFLLRHRATNPLSRIVWLIGAIALAGVAGHLWSGRWVLPGWLAQWSWWPALGLIPLALVNFPAGTASSVGRRFLAGGLLATVASSSLVLAVAAASYPTTLLTDLTTPLDAATTRLLVVAGGIGCLAVALIAAILIDLARRAWRSQGAQRRQMIVMVPSAGLLLLGIAGDLMGLAGALLPAAVALPTGLGVAVMQYRLDDLDLLVHRGLVFVVTTAVLTAVWVGTMVLVARTWVPGSQALSTTLAAGLVVVLADPLRRTIQRGLARAMFGSRGDPLGMLTTLGRRLEAATTPLAILELTVQELVTALKVPYAAVGLDSGEGTRLVTSAGRPGIGPERFPLTHDGLRLGELLIAPRRAGERFTTRERRMLAEVARQASVAAGAHQLTLELQDSRNRIVRGREVERLRLRRDLHDGLGPLLSGARMQLTAALRRPSGPDAAALRLVLDELGEAGQIVRELIDGLRPAALDGGLGPAIEHLVGALLPDHRRTIRTDGPLGELAPAVELAAYRIACEAVTNVARHADASAITVEVTMTGTELMLRIRDNGVWRGRPTGSRVGIGLQSMTERAEELGGTFTRTHDAPGTVLTARIPLVGGGVLGAGATAHAGRTQR